MPLLPSRRIIVTDKNINFHCESYVNTSINTTIQFPRFHRGTMGAVELRGPGFVFIGTKLRYASGSNVSARIECRSPETWSPHCPCEVLDAGLSQTKCKEVQVQRPWRKSTQNQLAWFICVLLTLIEHVSRHILLWTLQDRKAPHIGNMTVINEGKAHTKAYLWVILVILFSLSGCLHRDFLTPLVHPDLPVRPSANDRGFFSLCGPLSFL